MFIIAYILVGAASLVMVYFGSLQGQSTFYMTVFSAAIIWYCLYLDWKKRQAKKEENDPSKGYKKGQTFSNSKKDKDKKNIGQNAHKKIR